MPKRRNPYTHGEPSSKKRKLKQLPNLPVISNKCRKFYALCQANNFIASNVRDALTHTDPTPFYLEAIAIEDITALQWLHCVEICPEKTELLYHALKLEKMLAVQWLKDHNLANEDYVKSQGALLWKSCAEDSMICTLDYLHENNIPGHDQLFDDDGAKKAIIAPDNVDVIVRLSLYGLLPEDTNPWLLALDWGELELLELLVEHEVPGRNAIANINLTETGLWKELSSLEDESWCSDTYDNILSIVGYLNNIGCPLPKAKGCWEPLQEYIFDNITDDNIKNFIQILALFKNHIDVKLSLLWAHCIRNKGTLALMEWLYDNEIENPDEFEDGNTCWLIAAEASNEDALNFFISKEIDGIADVNEDGEDLLSIVMDNIDKYDDPEDTIQSLIEAGADPQFYQLTTEDASSLMLRGIREGLCIRITPGGSQSAEEYSLNFFIKTQIDKIFAQHRKYNLASLYNEVSEYYPAKSGAGSSSPLTQIDLDSIEKMCKILFDKANLLQKKNTFWDQASSSTLTVTTPRNVPMAATNGHLISPSH